MVIATSSELPGQRYEAIGLVSAVCQILLAGRTSTLDVARDELEAQAEAMGADAVIDVRMQVLPELSAHPAHPGPPRVIVALLGTAVRFL